MPKKSYLKNALFLKGGVNILYQNSKNMYFYNHVRLFLNRATDEEDLLVDRKVWKLKCFSTSKASKDGFRLRLLRFLLAYAAYGHMNKGKQKIIYLKRPKCKNQN